MSNGRKMNVFVKEKIRRKNKSYCCKKKSMKKGVLGEKENEENGSKGLDFLKKMIVLYII